MYEALALSGGGYKALAHLGVLAYLEDANLFDDVKTISGSSAGSIVAVLAALNGGSSRKLFEKYASKEMLAPLTCSGVFREYGVGTPIFKEVEEEVKARLGSRRATLRDLRMASGKRVIVSATGVRDRRSEFFGADHTTEGVPIVDAVRASSAIPMIMGPVELNNRLYLDGAITAYIPTQPLREVEGDKVMAISLSPRVPRIVSPKTPADYVEGLISAVLHEINSSNDVHSERVRHIDCGIGMGLSFPGSGALQEMFVEGYGVARDAHMADIAHKGGGKDAC